MKNCQWCDGLKNVVGFCQNGCAERPIYHGRCIDCQREFSTGRYGADQCRPCEQKENARLTAESSGDDTPHTGYAADMRKKGAARRVEEQRLRDLDVLAGEYDERSYEDAVDSGGPGSDCVILPRDR